MPHDVVVDVIVPEAPVVDVASVGVQGPPGEPGEPGPAGPPGPQGEPGDAAGPHAVTHQSGGTDPITALDAGLLTGTVTTNVMAPVVTATSNVSIGATPAQSGALRLGNNAPVLARNAANTVDLQLINLSAADGVAIGGGSASITLGAYTTTVGAFAPGSHVFMGAGSFLQLGEMAAPGVAPANHGYLYLDDNGAGKTRLMVQFATGAAIQLAIQP